MAKTQEARRFTPPAWLVAWGLSLISLALALSISLPRHHLEYVRIANRRGVPLWVVVYSPEPAVFARAPAAVVCQPFNSAPEYARLLALELVEDGFVVLTFDWRGRIPAENRQLMRAEVREMLRADVAAAVALLRARNGVDPKRIVMAGHSVGGTLAIEAATEDPTIAAVASIGMEADVTPERPRNLLWIPGLYDEFRVLNRMRDVFQASARTAALENTTVGDFVRGTARRLGVSPTADHFTELQDREIHRQVREWFLRAVDLPVTERRLGMEVRALLLLLTWCTSLAAALLTLRRLSSARRWVLRAAAAAGLVLVVLLTRVRGPHFLSAADAILWLLIFALLGGFISTREARALERGWRLAVRAGVLVWISLFLTLVVNNLANYVHEPRYLLWLPEFAVRHALDGLYAYLLVFPRPLVFSAYHPQALVPRVWLYAVMGAEVVLPGLLLSLVARLAQSRPRPASARPPRRMASAITLLLLLGVFGAVAWLRIQQGFLTVDSALAALRFLLRFTVLPLFIFALIWRRSRRLAMT